MKRYVSPTRGPRLLRACEARTVQHMPWTTPETIPALIADLCFIDGPGASWLRRSWRAYATFLHMEARGRMYDLDDPSIIHALTELQAHTRAMMPGWTWHDDIAEGNDIDWRQTWTIGPIHSWAASLLLPDLDDEQYKILRRPYLAGRFLASWAHEADPLAVDVASALLPAVPAEMNPVFLTLEAVRVAETSL